MVTATDVETIMTTINETVTTISPDPTRNESSSTTLPRGATKWRHAPLMPIATAGPGSGIVPDTRRRAALAAPVRGGTQYDPKNIARFKFSYI